MTRLTSNEHLSKIPEESRPLTPAENKCFLEYVKKNLQLYFVPDQRKPDAKIIGANSTFECRILLESVGKGVEKTFSWDYNILDSFLSKFMDKEALFWSVVPRRETYLSEWNELDLTCFKPEFFSAYTSYNRSWIAQNAMIETGMESGCLSLEKDLILIVQPNSDSLILAGDEQYIKVFDQMCGGKDKLCADLNLGLKTLEELYGKHSVYSFMTTHFPRIMRCSNDS